MLSEAIVAYAAAGRAEKGDVLVEIFPQKEGGLSIELDSSVQSLFGAQIHALAEQALGQIGLRHARVIIKDQGALDFVILARLESAARQVVPISGSGMLPFAQPVLECSARDRLRRTRLYLPGNNPDLMINAGLFGADCLILDLEDSVAPSEKDAARLLVRNALLALDFGTSERIVRINSLRTGFGRDDLETILPCLPDTLLIPKCEAASDIRLVEEIAEEAEARLKLTRKVNFMPLIESAAGSLHAEEIARASSRNVAVCFGAEDFCADLGVPRTMEGKESFVARSMIVLAARAAGIQAIDTVFSDVSDEAGLVSSTREAIAMGFEGKGVIHPAQIKPIHQCFCPTPEQVIYARQIVLAFETARAKGAAVVALGSKMIDAPVVIRAQKVLQMAKLYGLEPESSPDC